MIHRTRFLDSRIQYTQPLTAFQTPSITTSLFSPPFRFLLALALAPNKYYPLVCDQHSEILTYINFIYISNLTSNSSQAPSIPMLSPLNYTLPPSTLSIHPTPSTPSKKTSPNLLPPKRCLITKHNTQASWLSDTIPRFTRLKAWHWLSLILGVGAGNEGSYQLSLPCAG